MRLVFLAVLFGTPSTALAGEMTSALSFAGQWSASTTGYARALFPALLLVAFVVEIVFRDPSSPPSFRHSIWRAAIVLALLVPVGGQTLYSSLCGALAGLSDSMASTLAPTDPWAEFARVAEQWQDRLAEAKRDGEDGAFAAQIGGLVFTTVLSLGLLLGQGAMWVMKTLASVLVILLYALGPLALVFWIPFKSDSLGRWLRTFLTVLTWPVMSAVILAIITKASLQGLDGASPAFASIATALLLGVTALAVPVVSSSLVGGSMGAIGAGMSTLMQTAGLGATVGSTALGGAAGAGASLGAVGAQAASGAAGAVVNAMTADGPMSDGPPARGGPRAVGNVVPNLIDATPIHGAPAMEQPGLARGPQRSPVAALEDAAARGAPPSMSGQPASGEVDEGGRGRRGVAGAGVAGDGAVRSPAGPNGVIAKRPPPAALKPSPPVPSAAQQASPRVAPASLQPLPPPPPTEPAHQPTAHPEEDLPTTPSKKPLTWQATIGRLAHSALELEHAPDSPSRGLALRDANARLDRAVAAAKQGLSVDDWAKSESEVT
jgi:hypothetical protein